MRHLYYILAASLSMSAAASICWEGLSLVGVAPAPVAVLARSLVTPPELNACVAQAALDADMQEDPKTGQAAYLVNQDDQSLAKARSYDAGILAGETVYHQYLVVGSLLCVRDKVLHTPIRMPVVSLPKGCRIVRSDNGSSAEICGNATPPVFSCIDGYHAHNGACRSDNPQDGTIADAINPTGGPQ